MAKEAETDAKELREADALALAQLIYDIYQEKRQKEKDDEAS
jgi:hypothetical protein